MYDIVRTYELHYTIHPFSPRNNKKAGNVFPGCCHVKKNVAVNVELLPWWNNHKVKLAAWYKVVQEAVLLQPSSTGAERVFSMLDSLFGDEQEAALEDYKETSVIMRYNELKRRGINPSVREL